MNPVLKIEEQITDAIVSHSATPLREAKRMAADSLTAVGMPSEVAQMYPHELSGGMRQRVSIGMSTSLRPDLLLADEPTTGLDVVMVRLNLQTLSALRDEFDITVVFVSHDLACHAEICDRIIVMYAGRVMEVAPTGQLFADPLHPYTRGLINAVPSLEHRVATSIDGIAPTPLNWPAGCRFHPRCRDCMDICRTVEPEVVEAGDGRQEDGRSPVFFTRRRRWRRGSQLKIKMVPPGVSSWRKGSVPGAGKYLSWTHAVSLSGKRHR